MEFAILAIAAFFSLNMGASSFAASMATACGSGALDRRKARILYMVLIIAGALLLGQEVSRTLGKGIIPGGLIDAKALTIILATGSLSLFTANLMHIPQSTSLSTIAALCGVGMYYGQVNSGKIGYLAICWIVSTVVSFILMYFAVGYVYPPRKSNFWIYERVVHHQARLKFFVILSSAYNVFSQGTNNVANAVGPLAAAGYMDITAGLWIMGIFFSLGALTFQGPLNTASQGIVPLGLLSATVINLISGTITIVASIWGIPQPAVIIYTVAVFAVGLIKNGSEITLGNSITKRTFFTWCVNPVITLMLSYGLSLIFLK